MIKSDQPAIFGDEVIAGVSSKQDGNMKFDLEEPDVVIAHRKRFLSQLGIAMNDTTLVGVTYNTEDFAKYHVAAEKDKGVGLLSRDGVKPADALIVTEPGHALFLPLGDCTGAVLFDPEHKVLMMSHLGRHSVEIDGAIKSLNFLADMFKTDPKKLKVWLSPAVGSAAYPLRKFNGRGLREVITEQLINRGVLADNIERSPSDTAKSEDYYSHSQARQGFEQNGRFAIIAMMK